MRIDILTLFPAMFDGPLSESIVQRARDRGLVEIAIHDLRTWSTDRHRTVDDYPYGGGAGMVIKAEPVVGAIEALQAQASAPVRVLIMGAGGRPYSQALAAELAGCPHLMLICGHYEGFDQRIFDLLQPEEVAIGDYVLTGGELPAMVIVDSLVRLLPGAIDQASTLDESFTTGLLEYPHYTRPAEFRGHGVPPVLLSGHHAQIDRWRRREALRRTLTERPDLLTTADLTPADEADLAALRAERAQATATRVMTDHRHLAAVSYGDDANLAARQSIYVFQQPARDFATWALTHLPSRPLATLLDVGCGNGAYLRRLAHTQPRPVKLIGLDRSHGMLLAVRRDWPAGHDAPWLGEADIQALPLANSSCDAVLAMHMLYHVPAIPQAIAEVRRVLRPGGMLLVATNGDGHLAELKALVGEVVTASGHTDATTVQALLNATGRFHLENAEAVLQTTFASITRHDVRGELVVPLPEPIVRFVDSLDSVRTLVPDPAAWQTVLAEVEQRVAAAILRDGAFRIATHAGVFVCA